MFEEIINDLQMRLSPKRFAHTLGVARAAVGLAQRYGADPEEAYIAGLLHDCAKELPLSEMQRLVDDADIKSGYGYVCKRCAITWCKRCRYGP